MFEKLHLQNKHNRLFVGAGSILAAMGLSTTLWGVIEYDSSLVALNTDQEWCSYQDASACERLPAEQKDARSANAMLGNGVALDIVAASALWLAYSRDRNGQDKKPNSATSIELNFDKEWELFLQDKIPRDTDVPCD